MLGNYLTYKGISIAKLQLWKGQGTGNATFDDICLRRMPNPGSGNCQSFTNSSFENTIGTEWTPWGNVTQNTDATDGTYAAHIGGGVDGGISTSMPASPNKTYKLSIDIKENILYNHVLLHKTLFLIHINHSLS